MRRLAAILLMGEFCVAVPGQTNVPQAKLATLSPDSGLVLGIEWRRIIDSPVGTSLVDQINKSPLVQMPPFKSFQDVLLHDVDSVTISVPSSGLNPSIEQPPVLIIVKGRFETTQLRNLLATKGQVVEKYQTVELLVPPDSAPNGKQLTRVALLDSNTIIAGDRTQVRAAIDRIKAAGPAQARLIRAGAAELAAANDLWMILNIPPDMMKDAPPAMAQMLSGVKSAELGVSFKEGMATQMNFRTKDDASAQSLAQGIQGLVALAALNQDESSKTAMETLKRVRITAAGPLVKLELALDRAEFDKILQERQAPKTLTSAPARPVPAPSRPEPARSNTIRISGLDSGPLEIPMARSK